MQFNWSDTDYANIVSVFQFVYAISMLFAGRFIDWLGTKWGYAWSLIIWSFAAMAHALAKSTGGFMVARGFLGFGESGNFPAAIKTIAEWFPKKERALATGIFNSGTNVGAILAPLVVPWIVKHLGWQAAFHYNRSNRIHLAHFLVLAYMKFPQEVKELAKLNLNISIQMTLKTHLLQGITIQKRFPGSNS